jgi:adenine phosphoribosyltransferase
VVADARSLLLERFRWIDGHADVWRVFRHSDAFAGMIVALADPFCDAGVTAG